LDKRKVNGRDSCEVITARNAQSDPRNTFIIGLPSSFYKPLVRIEEIVKAVEHFLLAGGSDVLEYDDREGWQGSSQAVSGTYVRQ
jgi:hypothetical protein